MNRFRELFKAEGLPVFQNRVFRTPEEARNCPKGDVLLAQDLETGLIQNRAFDPTLMQYDADYQNEQAVSSVFRLHLNDVSEIIKNRFQNSTLIEVGCGKGFFLEHLQTLNYAITGLDPTYEGSNRSIIKDYFTPAIGLQADGIILRHVLEHIQDPVRFLESIRDSNAGGGKIYIEVPCFDWICQNRAWFDIFYEHVNYFRISDFQRIFGRVYESGRVFGGQYLYVVADLGSVRRPQFDPRDQADLPKDFLDNVNRYAKKLSVENNQRQSSRQSVVWGGASKGVIFSLYMQRRGAGIDFVVDINPVKQGKYLPATGLPIQAPEYLLKQAETPVDIYVMNSNYLAEIKQLTRNLFNYITVDHGCI